jgi:predicted nucleic-acid-binding protein
MDGRVIGIDTNILVRLLTRDDLQQFTAAVELVKTSSGERPLFVNPVVIAEVVWVLERAYGIDPQVARDKLAGLLDTVEIKVPDVMRMERWANWLHSPHPDISDVIIAGINRENGCEKTMTFDRKAAKMVDGMELLG